jgi:predicted nucleotidyltransferase
MAGNVDLRLEGVPGNVAAVLTTFISSIDAAYSADLISVVLYGSAAEGKLTSTSDVNLLVVLRSFSRDKTDLIRDTFLGAQAAINLQVMFLLEDEISSASELFAQKFADILRRHKVIFGIDPFSNIKIDRYWPRTRVNQRQKAKLKSYFR